MSCRLVTRGHESHELVEHLIAAHPLAALLVLGLHQEAQQIVAIAVPIGEALVDDRAPDVGEHPRALKSAAPAPRMRDARCSLDPDPWQVLPDGHSGRATDGSSLVQSVG